MGSLCSFLYLRHISNSCSRSEGPKECSCFSIQERLPPWTAQRTALTPFFTSPAFWLWKRKRMEPHGFCVEWEGPFLKWRGFFLFGSSKTSQSLTTPIPSARTRNPKGFFFFRAVFYAITGNLFSSETMERNSLLSVGASLDYLGDLHLWVSASFYTCCLYLKCRGTS